MSNDDIQLFDGDEDRVNYTSLQDAMRAKVAELDEVIDHLKPGRGAVSIRWTGKVKGYTYSMLFSFDETPR